MKKGKRSLIVFISALVVLLAIGAVLATRRDFSPQEAAETPFDNQEEITIRFAWWGNEERAEKMKEAIKVFEDNNPGIHVQTSYFPYNTYYENLTIAASVDNLPDVFEGYVGENNLYMAANQVEALDSYIASGILHVDDIYPNLLETGKTGGKLYGIPMGCNVKCLVVDVAAYQKAGLAIPEVAYDSWEDLFRDLDKLQQVTGAYGADDLFHRAFTMEYFFRQYGEDIYSGEMEKLLAFSRKQYIAFYTMKLDLIEKGLVPPYDVSEMASDTGQSELIAGRSAMQCDYASKFDGLVTASGRQLRLLLLPGPNTDLGTDIRASVHVCMSSQSSNKEAAARLIDFLINDVEANRILNCEFGMPASARVREAMMGDFNENQLEMARIVDLAESHSSPGSAQAVYDTFEIDDTFKELEEEIIYGEITPGEAYDRLVERFGSTREGG